MREKRDRTDFELGTRLALLRKEKGLKQGEFADEFTKYAKLKSPLTVSSVSTWEQNHRIPSHKTLIAIASFYDVSLDYLFGITDKRNETGGKEKQTNVDELITHSDSPIKNYELVKYNGLPIYIRSKDSSISQQWGILNYNNKTISCKDEVYNLTADLECFSYAVQKPIRTQIVAYNQLLATPNVWVEMISNDSEIRGLYNGRYVHNENKTALVKMDNGLVLKYSGLDSVYWAFRG